MLQNLSYYNQSAKYRKKESLLQGRPQNSTHKPWFLIQFPTDTHTPKGSLKLYLPVVGAFPTFHYVSHSFSLMPSETVITDLHVGQETASSSWISSHAQAVLFLHTVFSTSLFFVGKGLSMKNGMCCAVSSFCFCLAFIPRPLCPAKGEERSSFYRISEGE